MTRRTSTRLLPLVLVAVSCGGENTPVPDAPSGEPAAQAPAPAPARARPTGALEIPDWFSVDHDAHTVTVTMTAGATADNNYWNFNGHVKGELLVAVPVGYAVAIDFINEDPTMPHSLGISSELDNFMMPLAPQPVFPGAISSDPTSMTSSTMPGEREVISFTASEAGSYSLVCYIAGHTTVGMWVYFDVTADGSAGVATM